MKLSARNVLKGTVSRIVPGAVNSEVFLTLPDGTEIVSIISKDAVEELKLVQGSAAYAVIKASNVIIAVD
jgi:molybdopterin-binding protein